MKKKIILSAVCFIISLVILSSWNIKRLEAVTDTCQGVATTFNASFPSSVIPGQAFSLTNIYSQPSTSYGVTVTSSTLYLSATNAAQSSYSQNDTYTNPSPTTGASTYTAYYPDWAQSATGAAGSQIVVKLVQATAQVSGIGPVSCPLSATLATINITAPSSGGSSSSGSTNGSSSNSSKSHSTTAPATKTPGNQPSPANTTAPQTTTNNVQVSKNMPVTISVKDSKNNALKGAKVTLDNKQSAYTSSDGKVTFKDVTPGTHEVSVQYNKQTVNQTVHVLGDSKTINVPIVIPLHSSTSYLPFIIGVIAVMAASALVLVIIKKRQKSKLFINQPDSFIGNKSENNFENTVMTPTATVVMPTQSIVTQPSITAAKLESEAKPKVIKHQTPLS